MENLTLFFNRVKELSFWQRLFSWSSVKRLSYDAFEEFRNLQRDLLSVRQHAEGLGKQRDSLSAEKSNLGEKISEHKNLLNGKDEEIRHLRIKLTEFSDIIATQGKAISRLEADAPQRARDFDEKIARLNQLQDSLEKEQRALHENILAEQRKSFEMMKQKWIVHETSVKTKLKSLCQKHQVCYMESVPFRGSPDNTLQICGEYVIFDAKSPASDDLKNFPKYIKTQTEQVRKYVIQENVKKEVFLVVPTNAIHLVEELHINMGDYQVYIISGDALEPVILSLKKLEEYEFVNQLSPDERDNICRVIGKFAHTTRRKIQVDQFFAAECLNLLARYHNDLPPDILAQVIAFEAVEKLNPPVEKTAKQISARELQARHQGLSAEAGIREIAIPKTMEEMKNLQ